jgi:hypothetical protein
MVQLTSAYIADVIVSALWFTTFRNIDLNISVEESEVHVNEWGACCCLGRQREGERERSKVVRKHQNISGNKYLTVKET